ncbi:MAG: 50S ribosomal protein L7/L12 [Candidatus Nealsonbacteria bacterium]|nr:50S ribosomal protein L7/L12 [Candidatus Nealsonbacteria bacterium]
MTPEELAKILANVTVIDLNSTMKILEKDYGISVQAPVAAAPAAGNGAAAPAEEKSEFNIELKAAGEKKIEVIKVVRDVTGKGLKEAKDLVDAVASGPQMVKENVKKEEAQEIKKKFEAAGAQVELK